MQKYILSLIVILSLQISSLRTQEYSSQLTDLFKCLFIDSESGYVFFGSKPICYFGCSNSPHEDLIGTSNHELGAKLRLGIQWWKLAQPSYSNDNFVLKIRQHNDLYEILSLNKKEILQTVQDNLTLFRYILGPKVTPENLFTALSTSNEPFYKILNHNNTLVGILLGFGTENSLLGARAEALSDFEFPGSEIPYATLSNHSSEEVLNYLEISLLFKDNFKKQQERWKKSFEINTLEEEIEYIQNLREPSSHLLFNYSPRFIFENYHLQKNKRELLEIREKEQQAIVRLLQSNDFTDQVLKKLNVSFSNPKPNIQKEALSPTVLANALIKSSRLRLFDDLEGIIEGLKDADLGRTDRYPEPYYDQLYERLVIQQIEKNVCATKSYFDAIKQNSVFSEVSKGIFIKNLSISNQHVVESLQKNRSQVTVSYAVYLPLENEIFPMKTESHKTLNLNEAIQGFALGLQGMKPGELREIHVSPQAAYGFVADFKTSGPLKFLVRLESIEDSSPLLFNRRRPIKLKRPLTLSKDEIETLNYSRKALSYHWGKTFWKFYKASSSFSVDRLIEQLNVAWNNPGAVDNSLDWETLAVYAKQHEGEKNRVKLALKNRPDVIELIKDLLYVEYERRGDGSADWPKPISLIIKDMDGKTLKTSSYDKLTQNECALFCKGLHEGLKNSKRGDKGTFWIDPDLTDQGLFRNNLSHQALIVEFEVHPGI